MCRTKMATDVVSPKTTSSQPSSSTSNHRKTLKPTPSSNLNLSITATTTSAAHSTATTATSSSSLSTLRGSLPENPHLYSISEIRRATNNFLAKNLLSSSSSSSSRSWRCNLHGKDVVVIQRKCHNPNHLQPSIIRQKLSSICKSHHIAVVNLLGASISGDYIYLVYEFIAGASLFDLLHNVKNPNFTVLNTWMSRMQIATDLANGLDYIHNNTGLDVKFVHNHIKTSSVIITEPNLNAKICHFGTAELCGEPIEEDYSSEKSTSPEKSNLTRSNSVKFNGTRGYMSPEFQSTGIGTLKSDVYAFGVVLLELFSGEEPVKYKVDGETKEYRRISVIDGARGAVAEGDDGGGEERGLRMRRWVDRRLNDSFPVEVVGKITRLALDCVHVDPVQRPDMRRVAGKISKLYLESRAWCNRMSIPTDFTVSFAPR